MGRCAGGSYTPERRREICDHVFAEVVGGRAVTTILTGDDGMPDRATFWGWLRADPDLFNELVRAREMGVEAILEDAQAIADGDDAIPLEGLAGAKLAKALLQNDPKRARLRYDARVKRAQMLKPKTYGPRLDLTSAGAALGGKAPADDAERVAEMLRQAEARLPLDPKAVDLLS